MWCDLETEGHVLHRLHIYNACLRLCLYLLMSCSVSTCRFPPIAKLHLTVSLGLDKRQWRFSSRSFAVKKKDHGVTHRPIERKGGMIGQSSESCMSFVLFDELIRDHRKVIWHHSVFPYQVVIDRYTVAITTYVWRGRMSPDKAQIPLCCHIFSSLSSKPESLFLWSTMNLITYY